MSPTADRHAAMAPAGASSMWGEVDEAESTCFPRPGRGRRGIGTAIAVDIQGMSFNDTAASIRGQRDTNRFVSLLIFFFGGQRVALWDGQR